MLSNYNLQLISLVIIILIGFEHWLLTLKLDNYARKKYPKAYKDLTRDFGGYQGIPYYKEIIKNSHPNDKRYSFYINLSRLNLLAIVIVFIIFIVLI